ncbi:MAG TPA: hypothetical protein VK191_06195 [Symbiobacteriaceae bacterium]|nr:hypothetical protein [Symbiobacteriaceae bacterium]
MRRVLVRLAVVAAVLTLAVPASAATTPDNTHKSCREFGQQVADEAQNPELYYGPGTESRGEVVARAAHKEPGYLGQHYAGLDHSYDFWCVQK